MSFEGEIQNGVVVLDNGEHLPDGTRVEVIVRDKLAKKGKQPGTSLADWAEANAEDWGERLSSEDVAGFTGRRF